MADRIAIYGVDTTVGPLDGRFWDCECKTGEYIHSRSAVAVCDKCGAEEDDQPDSRVREIRRQTRWHEAIDTMVTIDRAIEWNDSEEKYLYVEYNVLDLVNDKAPMSKLDAVEYVEDRLQSLLDCTHSDTLVVSDGPDMVRVCRNCKAQIGQSFY
tara:strand:+ start:141 stop:605 length:465 start_codon:yes stop_codon:yes gene_type:complete